MTLRNLQGASIDELAQEYEQAAVAYGQALAAANHRAANRAHDRIASAYREHGVVAPTDPQLFQTIQIVIDRGQLPQRIWVFRTRLGEVPHDP